MEFPQPFGCVSSTSALAKFQANPLYYGGIRFDTAGAGWLVTRYDQTGRTIPGDSASTFAPIPGLLPTESVQSFAFPFLRDLGPNADGAWQLDLRIPTFNPNSGQNGAQGTRRFPFWIDRSPPVFHVRAESRHAGDPWRFRVDWTDLPEGLADVVELVRLRIRDKAGNVVAELPSIENSSLSGYFATWDGKNAGKDVADGVYTLEVVGKDGASPDAATLAKVAGLRNQILIATRKGEEVWTSARDLQWQELRQHADLNWARDTVVFQVDRKAPKIVFGAMPTKILGISDRFRLSYLLSDAGSTRAADTVRIRFDLRDTVRKVAFTAMRSLAGISGDSASPLLAEFAEPGQGSGRL